MITFAIPTKINNEEQKSLLDNLVYSITSQSVSIPHEILVCGNYTHENVTTLDFPEDLNGTSYITRKQNLLVENARYDIVVILRDYHLLWNDWVEGFIYWHSKDKNSWNIMMSPILNKDGNRYRDICHYYPADTPTHYIVPYKDVDKYKFYINGGYFVCNRDFMNKVKWDESLQWNQGEDINLSLRMRLYSDFNYCFNPFSIIQLQKQKDRILPIIPNEYFGSLEYVMKNYRRHNE